MGGGGAGRERFIDSYYQFQETYNYVNKLVEKSCYDSIYTHAFNAFQISGDCRNNK